MFLNIFFMNEILYEKIKKKLTDSRKWSLGRRIAVDESIFFSKSSFLWWDWVTANIFVAIFILLLIVFLLEIVNEGTHLLISVKKIIILVIVWTVY